VDERPGPPGAPAPTRTRDQARHAWTAFRAEAWLTLAEARGQRVRAAVLGRLTPGSAPFRAAVAIASPLLALRRRVRSAPAVESDVPIVPVVVPARPFPFGEPVEPPLEDGPEVEVLRLGPEGLDPSTLGDRTEWVALVDVRDAVEERALRAMAKLGEERGAELVYGDSVEVDEVGERHAVARAPRLGWVGQLSFPGAGRTLVVRRGALVDLATGALARSRLVAEVVLRLLENRAPMAHFAATVAEGPRVSYEDARGHAAASAAALARAGVAGEATASMDVAGLVRWRAPARRRPRVSVVIPTRDRLDLLEACLASIEARTTYPDVEVVIVDNDSVEPATKSFLDRCAYRVVEAPGPFNYAAIVNRGVGASTGEYVLTLNNDVEVVTDDWIEQLVDLAELPGVGIVGAYLEDPSGHPQHEGVAIAPYPQHLRRDRNWTRADSFVGATREVSAVTGACQLLSRALYDELGGMDESLAVVHNDVDLCLRARAVGRTVVYCATVRLLHAESSSRGDLTPPEDVWRFLERWGVLGGFVDPWFPERLVILGDVVRWRTGTSRRPW
jgi:GT2 family glycosyltransferase